MQAGQVPSLPVDTWPVEMTFNCLIVNGWMILEFSRQPKDPNLFFMNGLFITINFG